MSAVIFDVDGTLVDSNDEHVYAYVEAFYRHGYDVPYQEIRPIIGMGGDKLVPALIGRVSPKLQTSIDNLKGEIFKKNYLKTLKPYPEVRRLFKELRRNGVTIAIATSASKSDLKALLKVANVSDLVDVTSSADDAKRSKPDPDILNAVMAELDLPKSKMVMVGDTPYDLEAAQRAGIRSIAVRTGNWPDLELRAAVDIVDGVWELAN